ncbi:hypothetical protein GCM10018954_059200 [Kutzneria kofuensis]
MEAARFYGSGNRLSEPVAYGRRVKAHRPARRRMGTSREGNPHRSHGAGFERYGGRDGRDSHPSSFRAKATGYNSMPAMMVKRGPSGNRFSSPPNRRDRR